MLKETIFISSVQELFCPSVGKVHDTGQATVQVQNYSTAGMNNASLRKRIGMQDKQASQISRLIKEAMDIGKIKPKDTESESKKITMYVPYWA